MCRGEKRASLGVVKLGILRLRLSRGLDARRCRLHRRRSVMPWWRRGSYATTMSSLTKGSIFHILMHLVILYNIFQYLQRLSCWQMRTPVRKCQRLPIFSCFGSSQMTTKFYPMKKWIGINPFAYDIKYCIKDSILFNNTQYQIEDMYLSLSAPISVDIC